MNKLVVDAALAASSLVVNVADLYVSLATGKNRNAGMEEAPLKFFGAMSGKGAQDVK